MIERDFVDALIETIRSRGPHVAVIRPNDQRTIGVPDILAWVPWGDDYNEQVWSIAIEAKSLSPLMEDPLHRGRRIGLMLKHPFSGPQISLLRKLKGAGVDAFGLVRASSDTAFRIEPMSIPAATGNFTHEELVEAGRLIRRVNGVWEFWEQPE